MGKLDYPKRHAGLFSRVETPAANPVSTKPAPVSTPVYTTAPDVSTSAPTVSTRHGKHADPEAHRIRMREHMRMKRSQPSEG